MAGVSRRIFWAWLLWSLLAFHASAESIFFEAESMQPSSSGWAATSNAQTGRASRAQTLWGAAGEGDAVASKPLRVSEAGRYRVWVRYMQVAAWRGAFQMTVSEGQKQVAAETFDLAVVPDVADWEYTWQSLDADLSAGEVTLSLTKHEQQNCVGYVRHVDCVLLTTDHKLVPDHLPFGPQTLVRATLDESYDRPVYLHLFADHYRSPWYAHYAIGRDGIREELAPPAEQMLEPGEVTPWCNLTPTIYQDSGAALNLSVRHSYHEKAASFRAKLEFARGRVDSYPAQGHAFAERPTNDDVEIIRTFQIDATPNGVVIVVPPDLESPRNIALLKRDREFADEIGQLADAFTWPTHGRRPVRIPFLVTSNIGGYELPIDTAVQTREQKTLDYFGFNGGPERMLHGAWYMQHESYARPDLDTMRSRASDDFKLFEKSGRKLDDIAACMLMDEPTGQTAAFMANDEAYCDQFRAWLRAKSLTPEALLVASWEDVRPVVETDRDRSPALHYFTQLFRTRALGDFMATQRMMLEEIRGRSVPTMVNFSDGATYHANFSGQGVDYFELLDADDQNAIWGEDWANNSSTYQCAGFNVALMQAAALKRGQTIGHYLIAHAGRTAWDTKTKAVSETARGVLMWQNYSYGPAWGSHEGGPPSRSHLWWGKPELWRANAEIPREIGAVEDWLLTAEPAPADVAILYSSSSDVWTMWTNLASGFDRMHTWLALTHAQIPTDILSERDVEAGLLTHKVCYLSGPNLTRAAATALRTWVESGGTLFLTAGAASRDEFNRPLEMLTLLLPVERAEAVHLEPYHNAGKFLSYLLPQDTVTWGGEQLEVLSIKQQLSPVASQAGVNTEVLATYQDGQPAVVSGTVGKGRIIVCGFLPALSYIKPALLARRPLEQKLDAQQAAAKQSARDNADQPEATNATVSSNSGTAAVEGISAADREFLDRSYNPWQYPAAIRERILTPVRALKLTSSLNCDTPLIDAVELRCDQGILIALSNHTLRPLDRIELQLKSDKPVTRVESVRHGLIPFEPLANGVIRITLPLEASDFVTASTAVHAAGNANGKAADRSVAQ
jgi:hypothetical protein